MADQNQLPNKNLGLQGDQPKEHDYLFFSVMPKIKNRGDLVEPTIKVEQTASSEKTSLSFSEKLKKYKLYIIIGVVLVILGLAAYFGLSYLGKQAYKSDNLLVNNPLSAPKTKNVQTPTSTPDSAMTTPKDWRDKYFPNCTDAKICGDNADPDRDGLSNLEEYKLGTDPNNLDSDQDGLADGDEVHVFGSNPLDAHTAKDAKFTDADYAKGGFDFSTDLKLTADQIKAVEAKMQAFGLHEPTLTTLSDVLTSLYGFSVPASSTSTTASVIASGTPQGTASSTIVAGIDESAAGKLDRDTKRSNTILNVEIALTKYQADNSAYPQTNDFSTMFADVKPYLKVATNPLDPINQDPYVYTYASNASGTDFSLTFFSEGQGQIISKNSAEAIKDAANENANIYDNQRETDLEDLRIALLLYSNNNIAGNQMYVFPTKDKYKTALVPQFIDAIPKDPKTGNDYDYEVPATFDTFTLKTLLDNPLTGTTGYVCNQDACQDY